MCQQPCQTLTVSSHTGILSINHTSIHLTHCVCGHALLCLPLLRGDLLPSCHCFQSNICRSRSLIYLFIFRDLLWIQIVRSPFSRSSIWLCLSLLSIYRSIQAYFSFLFISKEDDWTHFTYSCHFIILCSVLHHTTCLRLGSVNMAVASFDDVP